MRSSTKTLTNNWMLGNEKARNAKQGGEKLRIQEQLVWNIHEAARGKRSTIMTLRCATCQIGVEEPWTSLEGSW